MSLRQDFTVCSLSNTLLIVTSLDNASETAGAVKVKLKDALQSDYEKAARRFLDLTYEAHKAMALYAVAEKDEFELGMKTLSDVSKERDRYLSMEGSSKLGDLVMNRSDATRIMLVDIVKMLAREQREKGRLTAAGLDTIERYGAQMVGRQEKESYINPNDLLYILQKTIEDIHIVYTIGRSTELPQHVGAEEPTLHVHRRL